MHAHLLDAKRPFNSRLFMESLTSKAVIRLWILSHRKLLSVYGVSHIERWALVKSSHVYITLNYLVYVHHASSPLSAHCSPPTCHLKLEFGLPEIAGFRERVEYGTVFEVQHSLG